ncbi:hypothetical protein NPIL_643691 [Nephila pilipes]|uniref:Uncharacterized protein n=1 Tax=Nephila pilipes TaxID=299642 RepID=A0A8X6QLZ6_NEPPI|nr:hypothetical protein NPIL_643691 [Nephila pilipes]
MIAETSVGTEIRNVTKIFEQVDAIQDRKRRICNRLIIANWSRMCVLRNLQKLHPMKKRLVATLYPIYINVYEGKKEKNYVLAENCCTTEMKNQLEYDISKPGVVVNS